MSSEVPVSTPGVDRVVRFALNGSEFGCRRPSRGDLAEIHRRFAMKLTLTGVAGESDILNAYDGGALLWEARFEVCLLPRLKNGQALNLGERAPTHWTEQIGHNGAGLRTVISFADVDPDEFDDACEACEAVFKKKATTPETPLPKEPSGSSVTEPTNA